MRFCLVEGIEKKEVDWRVSSVAGSDIKSGELDFSPGLLE